MKSDDKIIFYFYVDDVSIFILYSCMCLFCLPVSKPLFSLYHVPYLTDHVNFFPFFSGSLYGILMKRLLFFIRF